MKDLLDNLGKLFVFVCMFIAIIGYTHIVFKFGESIGEERGEQRGKRQMAQYIHEIRRITRLDALAPRTDDK